MGVAHGASVATRAPAKTESAAAGGAALVGAVLGVHGYDADVVAQFKVRRRGEKTAMSWGEFCYGPSVPEVTRLRERIGGGAQPRHPVAV
ncbi:hypothetical protein ACFVZN_04235 [Streptomyces virginiae]|uniref:hypothetical protein n=1 Tax=Streptomyces virginiae TaxID=1961 RepID=UPI00369EC8AE